MQLSLAQGLHTFNLPSQILLVDLEKKEQWLCDDELKQASFPAAYSVLTEGKTAQTSSPIQILTSTTHV